MFLEICTKILVIINNLPGLDIKYVKHLTYVCMALVSKTHSDSIVIQPDCVPFHSS